MKGQAGSKNYYNLFTDDKDEKIAKLEERLAGCTCVNKGAKGGNIGILGGANAFSDFQQEVSYLESCLQDERARNNELNDEVVVLRDTNEKLMEALKQADITAKTQEEFEELREALNNRNMDHEQAKILIEELKFIANGKLDPNKKEDLNKLIESADEMRRARDEAIKGAAEAKQKVAALTKKEAAIQAAVAELQKANQELIAKTKNMAAEREKAIREAQNTWKMAEDRRQAASKRLVEQMEYEIAQCKLRIIDGGSAMPYSEPAPAQPAPPPPPPAKKGKGKTSVSAPPPAAPAPAPAPAPARGPPSAEVQAELNRLRQQNIELLDKLKTAAADEKKRDEKAIAEQVNFFKKKLEAKEAEVAKLMKDIQAIKTEQSASKVDQAKVADMEKKMKEMIAEMNRLKEAYQTEVVLRKKYYNMVEDMKGKIRVYCRLRPISKSELDRGNKLCCTVPDEYTIVVDTGKGKKDFQYDRVFQIDETQDAVFSDVENLIQSAFDGYNVCIFAYGQTGSGKTFTLVGDPKNLPGIAPKAFKKIDAMIQAAKKFDCKLTVYMLELYNDKLLDLLADAAVYSDKLEIKKDSRGLVVVPGATMVEAKNEADLFNVFEKGVKNRHVASTKMNAESSRSHLVISIIIECVDRQTKKVSAGKLSVIDLAGSERIAKSGVSDEGAKEANAINMSLSALGDVISALTSEAAFIPYRNNKLTMLMQDSLGGNAKTLMFVNCSPVDYNAPETVNSLNYASRVKLIKNDATKNIDSAEVDRLKKIIARLQKGEKVNEPI